MFSSHDEQSSYQDNHLSYFTRSIVEAVAQPHLESIRYKDLIDYISDYFNDNPSQTPFFVTQGTHTEKFIINASIAQKHIAKYLGQTPAPVPTSPQGKTLTLLQAIQHDASRYGTKDDVNRLLVELFSMVEKYKPQHDVGNLFQIEAMKGSYLSDLSDISTIAKWLDQSDEDYFVKVNKHSESYTAKVRRMSGLRSVFEPEGDEDFKTVTRNRISIVDYRSTAELPYPYLKITLKPKYPNISEYECFIAPVVSKTSIRLFFSFARYKDASWDERATDDQTRWETISIALEPQSLADNGARVILEKFWNYVIEPINTKFGLVEDADSPQQESN